MVEMYAMRIAHNNVHFSHVTLDCANIRYCQLNLVTSPETVKVFLFPTAELQKSKDNQICTMSPKSFNPS